jgi:hypothetical protein
LAPSAPPFLRPDRDRVDHRPRPVELPGRPQPVEHAWCSRSHRPAAVHSANRRCAVGRVTANIASGSFHHEHPASVRYRIAASTRRSSVRRRPPPCGRNGAGGISGAAISHNESGTHFAMTSSSTKDHHGPSSDKIQMRHGLTVDTPP